MTVPPEEGDQRLGVANGAVHCPGQRLVPGDDARLQFLVRLGAHRAGRQVLGEEQVDHFAEHARRGDQLGQFAPALRRVAGFLLQFAHRRDGWRLARFEGPGRHLPERLVDDGPVVTKQTDVTVVYQGEYGDGTGMEDHVAGNGPAVWEDIGVEGDLDLAADVKDVACHAASPGPNG